MADSFALKVTFLLTTQVVRFRVQRFTVNPDLAGFSSCFQSEIACFLDFVCQTVWHVKKSDEQGICLKNRAPPSLLRLVKWK